jgi:hypothetical protein
VVRLVVWLVPKFRGRPAARRSARAPRRAFFRVFSLFSFFCFRVNVVSKLQPKGELQEKLLQKLQKQGL